MRYALLLLLVWINTLVPPLACPALLLIKVFDAMTLSLFSASMASIVLL